ncbi:MAG: amidohydrolase [Thermodesulfobacteriota bacterium]
MPDLKITLIQTALIWENIEANLEMFDQKLEMISGRPDLIILPEMFTTGFTMNAEKLAQPMSGSGVGWLRKSASLKQSDIVGSLIITENGKYFNRLVWMRPDGSYFTYDKKHLFRMAKEDQTYSEGRTHLTVSLNGWNIRPFICYDLRFPVWTRNLKNSFDLSVFIANWPKSRSAHWKALLVARAIENQCYVAGCNRIGVDGNRLLYAGDSSVIDPQGNLLYTRSDEPSIVTQTLSYQVLQKYRSDFPAWMDADTGI